MVGHVASPFDLSQIILVGGGLLVSLDFPAFLLEANNEIYSRKGNDLRTSSA